MESSWWAAEKHFQRNPQSNRWSFSYNYFIYLFYFLHLVVIKKWKLYTNGFYMNLNLQKIRNYFFLRFVNYFFTCNNNNSFHYLRWKIFPRIFQQMNLQYIFNPDKNYKRAFDFHMIARRIQPFNSHWFLLNNSLM